MTAADPTPTPTPAPTPAPAPPAAAASAPRCPRWVRAVLVLSLAVNLLVAGLVAGAWLRGGPPGAGGRDPGFGPFAEALSDTDRRELRRAVLARLPEMRAHRQALRADMQGVLAALRADPFDPDALAAAMDSAMTRLSTRIDVGQQLLLDRIAGMDSTERQAFADRLESVLARGMRGGPDRD